MRRPIKVKYVGRASGQPSGELPNGKKLTKGKTAELEPRQAWALLRAPGQADDSNVDWVRVEEGD